MHEALSWQPHVTPILNLEELLLIVVPDDATRSTVVELMLTAVEGLQVDLLQQGLPLRFQRPAQARGATMWRTVTVPQAIPTTPMELPVFPLIPELARARSVLISIADPSQVTAIQQEHGLVRYHLQWNWMQAARQYGIDIQEIHLVVD